MLPLNLEARKDLNKDITGSDKKGQEAECVGIRQSGRIKKKLGWGN